MFVYTVNTEQTFVTSMDNRKGGRSNEGLCIFRYN